MKKLLPFALAGFFIIGCTQEREIQMSITNVQLVKIDTIQRFDAPEQLLTWRSDDHVNYITFEPMNTYYLVGARMTVMVKK